MTEREAWEALAVDAGRERSRLARGGVPHVNGPGDDDAMGITHNGLCGGLCSLPVSTAVFGRMEARIVRELRTRQRNAAGSYIAYLWPLTPSGFKRRAAWARKQAAR